MDTLYILRMPLQPMLAKEVAAVCPPILSLVWLGSVNCGNAAPTMSVALMLILFPYLKLSYDYCNCNSTC